MAGVTIPAGVAHADASDACSPHTGQGVCVTTSASGVAVATGKWFPAADLGTDPQSDVGPTTYPLHNPSGGTYDQPVQGTSVEKLVQASYPSVNVHFATVTRSDNTNQVATLSSSDLTDPNFTKNRKPVFTADPFAYIRPPRSSSDYNGRDFEPPAGRDDYLTLTLSTTGVELRPTIRPTKREITAGDSIGLTASLQSDLPPGESYTYRWDFGDTVTTPAKTSPTTTHTYPKTPVPFSYVPSVIVQGDQGSYGQYFYDDGILVGTSKAKPVGGGKGGNGAKPKGPNQGPPSGTGDNASTTRTSGRNGAGVGSPRPGVSGATGAPGAGAGDATQPGAAVSTGPKASRTPPAAGGQFVRGQALSDPQVVLRPGAPAVTDPAVAVGARAPAQDDLDLTPLWLLLLPALVGLGALGERRRPHRASGKSPRRRNGART